MVGTAALHKRMKLQEQECSQQQHRLEVCMYRTQVNKVHYNISTYVWCSSPPCETSRCQPSLIYVYIHTCKIAFHISKLLCSSRVSLNPYTRHFTFFIPSNNVYICTCIHTYIMVYCQLIIHISVHSFSVVRSWGWFERNEPGILNITTRYLTAWPIRLQSCQHLLGKYPC